MKGGAILGQADGVLPALRAFSFMPLLVGIMLFLSALALAAAFSLTGASASLSRELSRTLTVQIVHGDAVVREREARAAGEMLASLVGVASVKPLTRREIGTLIEPWLGSGAIDPDLPLPALIDVTFDRAGQDRVAEVRLALARIAPHARVEEQAAWLTPLSNLLATLRWLGLGIVLLVAFALVGTIVLATRAALNTHRETIEVMHLMGATDGQISRLFERRSAVDGLIGGVMALAGVALVMLLVQTRALAVGSGLLGGMGMPGYTWAVLALLPLAAAVLASATAHVTVFRSLRGML